MGKQAFVALLVAAAVLCGCATPSQPSGDFGAFLQRTLVEHGARLRTDHPLPAIQAAWKFNPDRYGFIVFVHGDHFGELDSWLRQACGEPKFSTEQNDNGHPQRVYDSQIVGVFLACAKENKGVTITCVKRQSR